MGHAHEPNSISGQQSHTHLDSETVAYDSEVHVRSHNGTRHLGETSQPATRHCNKFQLQLPAHLEA